MTWRRARVAQPAGDAAGADRERFDDLDQGFQSDGRTGLVLAGGEGQPALFDNPPQPAYHLLRILTQTTLAVPPPGLAKEAHIA